jgi:nucleotide-binding universal stress UspA family protein
MTSLPHSPRIVVGYDGSASSRAALRLAIDHVGDGRIFVVHGYDAPADYWGSEHHDALLNVALTRGEHVLEQAREVEPRLAQVDHELELIAGRPAEVIATVAKTRDADGIIVGTRGFGRLRGALGSVAHGLLHEASCPVTIIPDAALQQPDAGAEQQSEEVAAP